MPWMVAAERAAIHSLLNDGFGEVARERRSNLWGISFAAALLGCGEAIEPCTDDDAPPAASVTGTASLGASGQSTEEELLAGRFPVFAGAPLHPLGQEPSYEHVDVMFVSEGFRSEDVASFREEVDELATDFELDELGRAFPGAFRFHRLEVASPSARVKNAALDDTALGACPRRLEDDSFTWRVSNPEPLQLLDLRFPEVDVIVVIINGSGVRSSADLGFVSDRSQLHVVRFNRGDGVTTLTHELGHALFSLGDEYWDVGAPLPQSHRLRGPAVPRRRQRISHSSPTARNGAVSRSAQSRAAGAIDARCGIRLRSAECSTPRRRSRSVRYASTPSKA